MKLSRRVAMIGAGVGAAALATPALAKGRRAPALAVCDSRLPDAARFARECAAHGVPVLDLAREDMLRLRELRLNKGDQVVGVTGWSQFILLQGMLNEQGLRVREETRVDREARSIFRWSMA